MRIFRLLLAFIFVGFGLYINNVIQQRGWAGSSKFFEDMLANSWPGVFNVDFFCLLAICALWVAWRHGFTLAGMGLAVLTMCGGTLFFAPYLFVISLIEKGNVQRMLTGNRNMQLQ